MLFLTLTSGSAESPSCEHQELLRTPCLCFVLYVGDQLVAVDTVGSHTHRVRDVIATLRTGEQPPEDTTTPSASAPIGRCPEYGTACLSGQGIYTCLVCRWIAGTTAGDHYQEIPALRGHWKPSLPGHNSPANPTSWLRRSNHS